jgi:hypothetical protein
MRSHSFFRTRFRVHRFAEIPPRIRFGSRLAQLVRMTIRSVGGNLLTRGDTTEGQEVKIFLTAC